MKIEELAKPWVAGLEKYVPGEFREGFVKIASNENNYGPSPKVVKAIRDAAGKSYIYPHLDDEIRKNAARYAGMPVDFVMTGNGSDELMEMALKTFQGPVASVYPSYASYRIFPRMLGMEFSEVNLKEDFSFDVNSLISKTRQAKIFFIGSPNNPTGTVIEESDLVRILDEGKIVVLDEAYYEFSNGTFIKLVKDYENLIVLRTLSKAFGLGGLRVGYTIANPKVIGLMSGLKPPFSIASISEVAALAALEDLPYMRKCVKKIVRDRELLLKKLGAVLRVYPSKANFLLADVSPMTAREFFKKMLKHRIIVRNFGRFRDFNGEYVRITVGTSGQNRRLLDAVSHG
jgi:histidinol-phosphate aminotransferase